MDFEKGKRLFPLATTYINACHHQQEKFLRTEQVQPDFLTDLLITRSKPKPENKASTEMRDALLPSLRSLDDLLSSQECTPIRVVARGGNSVGMHVRKGDLDCFLKLFLFGFQAFKTAKARERFDTEVSSLEKLQGEGWCPRLYGSGSEGKFHFILMEFVMGQPLTPMEEDFESAVELMITLASQVEAMHMRGVLHRDLKPDNILASNKSARLVDFGLTWKGDDAGKAGSTVESTPIGNWFFFIPTETVLEKRSKSLDTCVLTGVFFFLIFGVYPLDLGSINNVLEKHGCDISARYGESVHQLFVDVFQRSAVAKIETLQTRFQNILNPVDLAEWDDSFLKDISSPPAQNLRQSWGKPQVMTFLRTFKDAQQEWSGKFVYERTGVLQTSRGFICQFEISGASFSLVGTEEDHTLNWYVEFGDSKEFWCAVRLESYKNQLDDIAQAYTSVMKKLVLQHRAGKK